MRYDPRHIARYYDEYGEREWERFANSPRNKVNFHIHRWYLQKYVTEGAEVLEVGAGPGRFTIELAHLGARITVGDISPRQLALNQQMVEAAGCEGSVRARLPLDIVDLSRFPNDCFDATVCYGGPLSYVFDQADQAVDEMLRVTRTGGYVFLSVMSLLGTTRVFLPNVLDGARQFGIEPIATINATGDLTDEFDHGHVVHRMYRWERLEALLRRHPCSIVAASASNFLSVQNDLSLAELEREPDLWAAFLEWEVEFCRQPGALDAGTHILAVVQRP